MSEHPVLTWPALRWKLTHCDDCGCEHAHPCPDCTCVCHEESSDGAQ
jgi:hypothetical protein